MRTSNWIKIYVLIISHTKIDKMQLFFIQKKIEVETRW